MPITDIGSYPPTMEQFSEHWEDVDAALVAAGEVALTLQGAFASANFDTLQTEVSDAIDLVDTDTTLTLAQAVRDGKKQAIRARMSQMRGAVESQLPDSQYEHALPTLPSPDTDESKFLRPFKTMKNLWTKVNAEVTVPGFTPPLLLQGGYALANFVTELTALQAAFDDVTAAEDDLRVNIRQRDRKMKQAFKRMKQYRVAVVQRLAPGDPLLQSVPELSPPPGSTPDAVTLTGAWNAGTSLADLSWTASTEATLDHYALRASSGAVYDPDNHLLVGNVAPEVLAFSTAVHLGVPGNQATFKVFVVLTTGNEKGSNAVAVTRP